MCAVRVPGLSRLAGGRAGHEVRSGMRIKQKQFEVFMNSTSGVISIIAISIGIAILLFIAWYFFKGRNIYDPWEDMDGNEFEHYCADILRANSFEEINVTAASRDYGIDILAQKDGIKYAIQCKYYSDPVGIKAVQEAYAGKDYYDAMIAVVMTNQDFTKTALHFAEKLNVLMWDGDTLYNMYRTANRKGEGI